MNLEYTHLSALQLLVAGDENHFFIHACQLSPSGPDLNQCFRGRAVVYFVFGWPMITALYLLLSRSPVTTYITKINEATALFQSTQWSSLCRMAE